MQNVSAMMHSKITGDDVWNYKVIRKNSWNTAFRKSIRAWLGLVIVGFLFAFLGVVNISSVSFIDVIDTFFKPDESSISGNVQILKDYVLDSDYVKNSSFISSDYVIAGIESMSKSSTWVIQLFGANLAFFQRNPGEVIFNLIMATIVAALVRLFIQNVIVIGRNRYALENRYSKEVP